MKRKEYNYLIVGAGLFGATFACMARQVTGLQPGEFIHTRAETPGARRPTG